MNAPEVAPAHPKRLGRSPAGANQVRWLGRDGTEAELADAGRRAACGVRRAACGAGVLDVDPVASQDGVRGVMPGAVCRLPRMATAPSCPSEVRGHVSIAPGALSVPAKKQAHIRDVKLSASVPTRRVTPAWHRTFPRYRAISTPFNCIAAISLLG